MYSPSLLRQKTLLISGPTIVAAGIYRYRTQLAHGVHVAERSLQACVPTSLIEQASGLVAAAKQRLPRIYQA